MYEYITENHKNWNKKLQPLKGIIFKIRSQNWRYVGCNDIGHPYFSRVMNGRTLKKQFTLPEADTLWALNQLEETLTK